MKYIQWNMHMVLFCHVWLLYYFRMDKYNLFVYIIISCFNGTAVILRSAQCHSGNPEGHYGDVIKSAVASQITSLAIVYLTVFSKRRSKKHQSSASLAFVRGIHRSPANSPRKEPVTRKMFPFDDVIMIYLKSTIDKLQQNTRQLESLGKFVGCILRGYILWIYKRPPVGF